MYPVESLESDPKIVPVASVPVGRPIQAQSIGSEVVEVNGNLSVVTAVDAATNAVASHAGKLGAHFSTKPARRFTLKKRFRKLSPPKPASLTVDSKQLSISSALPSYCW